MLYKRNQVPGCQGYPKKDEEMFSAQEVSSQDPAENRSVVILGEGVGCVEVTRIASLEEGGAPPNPIVCTGYGKPPFRMPNFLVSIEIIGNDADPSLCGLTAHHQAPGNRPSPH
jgi:hypothetical protein